MIIIISTFLLSSCNEEVKPSESELVRYPYMSTFTVGRESYRGIVHNLDTGYYSFVFKTSFPVNDYFIKVNSIAKSEGWKVIPLSKFSYEYHLIQKTYPHELDITLTFNPKTEEVIFEQK